MNKPKKKQTANIESEFDETVARLLQTAPGELANSMTRGLVNRIKETEKRIKDAREEISRGARSGKKPFRL